ncbi:hypothetical protein RYX36_033127, partial [Vicia faba]
MEFLFRRQLKRHPCLRFSVKLVKLKLKMESSCVDNDSLVKMESSCVDNDSLVKMESSCVDNDSLVKMESSCVDNDSLVKMESLREYNNIE